MTVNIKDVNETPEFAKDSNDQLIGTTLYIDENTDDAPELRQGMASDADDAAAYSATDDDEDDNVTYTLEGAGDDDDFFELGSSSGALTAKTASRADHEDQASYSLVIVATGGAGDRALYGRLAVTVEVVDGEDDGEVELSALEPQVGRPVLATLTDEDGGVTAVSWKWYRGGARATTADQVDTLADVDACTDDDPATPQTACEIEDAAGSALYTPEAADVGFTLHAVATYKDNIDSDQDTGTPGDQLEEIAGGSSMAPAQVSDPANTAPKFPDQDLNTAGDQSDTAMRSVAENADKGTVVGEPIPADDTDLLLYSLNGDDASSFTVVKTDGQIKTAEELDYETKSEYMVTLMAMDPSGATDTINVMITVTDENDGAVIVGVEGIDYPENGEDPVATFSATDADGDEIEWSLSGVDEDAFEIDGGVLTFKESPDFEGATDMDEDTGSLGPQGEGDNVYQVTVEASDGTLDVAVTVTNADEAGSVSFDQPQPQVTRDLTADFDDEDGEDGPSWEWSRGPSADGPWTDIDGAMTAKRNPTAADVGSYLRATVTYTDSFGAQTASGVTDSAVEARTVSNAAPEFDEDDIEAITVNENTKGAIGDPILASDGDNDVLLYSLGAVDVDGTPGDDTNDNALFTIAASTGQLSLKDNQDFEADPSTSGTTDTDGNDDLIPYTVVVVATDPSSATGSVVVTVNIKDVNETPEFAKDSNDQLIGTTLYIDENTDDAPELRQGMASDADDAAAYSATDDDEDDNVTYTLEGAGDDDDFFELGSSSGALTAKTASRADHEDQASYSLVIVATGGAGDRALYGRLAVTVEVVDGEDDGEVELSALEPQVGRPVLATLTDEDGGVTAVSWKWYRGGTIELEATGDVPTITACDPEDSPQTDNSTACEITDAAGSALYTPGDDDVERTLHAIATYKDNQDSDMEENAVGSSMAPAQESNPANTAPEFPDQDLNTAGDQSDTAMRSVAENADKGTVVGEPIPADDTDLLLYSLNGDDASSFTVVKTDGQIKTAEELDYETKSEYMVTLMAMDPSGAYDMITVMITVTDENDGAIITTGTVENNPPAFAAGTATRSVDENMAEGAAVGDPVTATDDAGDTVTYELTGSTYFEIDGDGQITTTMMLDHEAMSTHAVTVTATDSAGESDSVDVTINVDNAHTGCDTAGNHGLVNDCEALLDSKDALGGSLNWAGDTAMSDWGGVTMSGDPMRVTAINLRDQGLDGTIPGALGRVGMLTSLNLRSNADLSGDIPASLGDLSNLTVLNLHSNSHMGDIPDLSGTALQELYLSQNDLTGGVPGWLNTMTDMQQLWLTGNQLAGALPDLNGMTSLEILKLNGNMVSGFDAAMLPSGLRWLIAGETDMGSTAPDLSSLMSLTTLWMNENGLMGAVPVANIPSSVTSLNLKGNALSGTIPDMSSLTNLEYLRLHRNELSGDIPGTLGDLDSIERIWLYENDLTGISAGLAKADDTLTHLFLAGNNFDAGTCLPGSLDMVANNDFTAAGLAACGDGS